jgi:hypothetical protein
MDFVIVADNYFSPSTFSGKKYDELYDTAKENGVENKMAGMVGDMVSAGEFDVHLFADIIRNCYDYDISDLNDATVVYNYIINPEMFDIVKKSIERKINRFQDKVVKVLEEYMDEYMVGWRKIIKGKIFFESVKEALLRAYDDWGVFALEIVDMFKGDYIIDASTDTDFRSVVFDVINENYPDLYEQLMELY